MAKTDDLVRIAKEQLGATYVWGAWGKACTPAYRKQYAGYRPQFKDAIYKYCPVLSNKQSTCTSCKYAGKRAFDCRGLTCWSLGQIGIKLIGEGATSQYNTSANWAQKGELNGQPSCVCILFRGTPKSMSHTGIYIGNGKVIHASGHSTGVIESTFASGKWTHYGIPKGLYESDEEVTQVTTYETLRKGNKGPKVEELQKMLNAAGFDCGTVDGIFGTKTQTAVTRYQVSLGIAADGIVGQRTWGALTELLPDSTIPATGAPVSTVPVVVTREEFDALVTRISHLEKLVGGAQ